MEKLNELAAEIVENLVACDSAEPEAVEQYQAWTLKRLAEAFRVLERTSDTNMAAAQAMRDDMYHWKKRAEAAEAKLAEQGAEVDKANALIDELRAERDLLQRIAGDRGNKLEAAEAKLAELAKQPPVAYTDAEELDIMQKGTYADMFKPCDEYKSDPKWIPLFTRPAPAADLAELVPAMPSLNNGIVGYNEGWNSCRATILRNIEEKS
ncbi:hypothetical protein [Pantoea agglomerans]|uniref:hypothetical protein n=1 Tax=Enterobacter agglomerans TaxID=549 RepID=UPI002413AF99|nr:hypothetical protein [Pantoea agglomerans]